MSYRAAAARLKTGDTAGYARICERAEAAVLKDVPVEQLNDAAWQLSLAPGGARAPDRLAERFAAAFKAAKGPMEKHMYANTLGAVLIRAGRYAEGVQWLERGVAADGDKRLPEDAAFLAIAHRRLGDGAGADVQLAKARKAFGLLSEQPEKWADCVVLELLIAEAAPEQVPYPRLKSPVPPAGE
ncbi:hypothetical protein FTUN_5954 [Frigoriglobus tundricola]|uniref:Tetratricopeptide repeat protein n=2 Tax=Frigoriglobus tundricola TaxID=2774151 RepID=A0A6M5YY66_9BACT|nr:hypothetical protein FTUN_5954 [Frigoriglobus tundricola]